MAAQLLRRRFTVLEYHQMGQVGILSEDDRLELLEGEVVEMAPIGSRHQAVVNRLTKLFSNGVGDSAVVSVQGPVRLGEETEPQPDLLLIAPRDDFYASSHPGPEDVLLLIEVSDTSTEYDREVKLPLYARYGITEVWLVGLETGTIEICRSPAAQGYQEVSQAGRDQSVAPVSFPQMELKVADIIG